MHENLFIVRFTKTGRMAYISHLDLARLFVRVLRRAGLRPAYSRGFNPHPRLSFCLPLSLGQHSECELLEFEVAGAAGSAQASEPPGIGAIASLNAAGAAGKEDAPVFAASGITALNDCLPDGIRVIGFARKPARYPKSLAAYVDAATYEIMCEGIEDARTRLGRFLAQTAIPLTRTHHKSGKTETIDIRPRILSGQLVRDIPGRMLCRVTLKSGAGELLNPRAWFDTFCAQEELGATALSPVITRVQILDQAGIPIAQEV